MSDLILILTTMPDQERAEALARTLVEERLAACVNVGPAMISIYRWQGAVQCDAERQVVIKTTSALVEQLRARLTTLHPYELPEFVVLQAAASDAYLSWVAGETRPSDA